MELAIGIIALLHEHRMAAGVSKHGLPVALTARIIAVQWRVTSQICASRRIRIAEATAGSIVCRLGPKMVANVPSTGLPTVSPAITIVVIWKGWSLSTCASRRMLTVEQIIGAIAPRRKHCPVAGLPLVKRCNLFAIKMLVRMASQTVTDVAFVTTLEPL